MRVVSGLMALALLGCGGRSRLDLDRPAPSGSGGQTSASGGQTSPNLDRDGSVDPVPPNSVGLDVGALAAARCAGFPPAPALAFVAEAIGFPRFGACGHLTMSTSKPTPIWSPDLRVLVASARAVSFSPEGTRAIFVPAAPEDNRVRRLDLLTMQAFDTAVTTVGGFGTDALNFGLFVDPRGDVESWVCSGGDLRIFADRTADESPLFEASVPSCSPVQNDATLVWQVGADFQTVDLRGHRRFEQTLPPYAGSVSDGLWPALDGYAGGRFTIGVFTNGPLYSLRDGSLLANTWEQVPYAGSSNNAANRLDPDLALLIDDGDHVINVPGLRGVYVFRDKRRAFGFQAKDNGAAELVYVNLASGETTPIAEYSNHVLDPSRYISPTFGISPSERVAYFPLDPVADPSSADAARASVVAWIDGDRYLLGDTVPVPSMGPAVADDGTAVFMGTYTSTCFRPGGKMLTFSKMVGLDLSRDGEVDLSTPFVPNQSLCQLVATNLDDGTASVLLSNLSTFTEATDFFHERFAVLFGTNADTTPHELWAGRFPAPSR
jgi:hypothetical protein